MTTEKDDPISRLKFSTLVKPTFKHVRSNRRFHFFHSLMNHLERVGGWAGCGTQYGFGFEKGFHCLIETRLAIKNSPQLIPCTYPCPGVHVTPGNNRTESTLSFLETTGSTIAPGLRQQSGWVAWI